MKTDREYWSSIWHQALANAPHRARAVYTYRSECKKLRECSDTFGSYCISCIVRVKSHDDQRRYGKNGALARFIGLPLTSLNGSKNYSVHNRIYTSRIRGDRPRNLEVRHKLEVAASPMGRVLMWFHLVKLGISHRYQKPNEW